MALGCHADWAGLPIGLKKPGWQIRTHYFTVTLELKDALEINVTELLMDSLDVLRQSGILEQRTDGICRAMRVLSGLRPAARKDGALTGRT